MYCKYCGKMIPDDSKYCACCGSMLVLTDNTPLDSREENIPKTTKEKTISDKWMWTLATVPIVAGWSTGFILGFLGIQNTIIVSGLVFCVTFSLNCLFLCLDISELKRSGVNPNAWLFLGFVLLPVYLFIREAKTNKNWIPGIIYCVLLTLDICSGLFLGFLEGMINSVMQYI